MIKINNWNQNKVSKSAINKSSNLATCLENWEQKYRELNQIYGSKVNKNALGLITEIEFFYNDFKTVTNGEQFISWKYLMLSDHESDDMEAIFGSR